MIAEYKKPLYEQEIKMLLDYYEVDLTGLAVFVDDGFEWLASQVDKYKMAYIVNPLFTFDVRNDKIRGHSKTYFYEDSDFIIDVLDEDNMEMFDELVKFSNRLHKQFMILGPYHSPNDFTLEDAFKYDRIIESNIEGKCWYLSLSAQNLHKEQQKQQ